MIDIHNESNFGNTLSGATGPERERYGFLKILLIVLVTLLAGRSFYLQVINSSHLQLQAEENRISFVPRHAPRGIIYDRHGEQLVENIASTDLVLDPIILPDEENEAPLLEQLTSLTEIPPEKIKEAINQTRQKSKIVLLKKDLQHESVVKIESNLDKMPGVRLISSSVRNYLYPYSLSHLMGYTGLVTADELKTKKNLIMNDVTGKAGIEKYYDDVLRGKPGTSYIEVNAAGHPQKELDTKKPVAGQDLHLSIDSKLQEFLFSLLAENNYTGSIIAQDPNTGAIKALVNYPAFDPNTFSQPSRSNELSKIFQDERQPLFNRACNGTYAPGSTIKPLIAAAGLEEKIITKQTSFLSTGGINIGIWQFPDWKAGGHGQTNVTKAIAESVNTFFYLLSGGDDKNSGLGVKKINQYLRHFSWGEKTGIDLPNEAEGLLPSQRWKQETKNESWYIGDTYHLGIGQGDVLATPLQIAVSTSAIANRGTIYQPSIANRNTNQSNIIFENKKDGKKIPIQRKNIDIVREGMRQAVTQGSARRLNDLPIKVAGKTGTAQYGSGEGETHAWFTSFGPYEKPELTITVLLEKGGKGDENAVPVAKEIWQWWYENK